MTLMKGNKNSDDYKRHLRVEESRATGWLNVVLASAVAAVAYTDWAVVANLSVGYLYVLPIALSALVNPLPITVALAVLCTFLQEIFGPPPDSLQIRMVHIAIGLASFLIVGFLVTLIAKQRERLAAEVRRQRDEYERDLVLASQVQRQVLPTPPIVPGLEMAAGMQTARLLGGDYYDFFQISDDVIDVVIADVSGKGAAASLLMPSLAVALRLRARELSGPAAIMKDLDRVLKQITNPATFVTMFYARFHPKLGTLQYANGGHNPPLLFRSKTGESVMLEASGPIVGILADAQFSDMVISLQGGDVVTLYTDGVTEQENEGGEEFGVERLRAAVQSAEEEAAAAVVARITEAVSSFAGPTEQADDLTLVVVKVL
jgi:serine phosphatase RsbU (regulator of sigma subunit)